MLNEGMVESGEYDGHGLWSPEVSPRARGPRHDDWRTLHARLQTNLRQRTVLEAAAADLLLEAEETQLYLRLGYPTMTVYMERELACSRHTAAEHLRVAHELVELPMIAAEYRAGELPFTVVREVTRPATADTEGAWLDAIRGKTSSEVQQLVKGRKKGDRPEQRPDPKLIKERIFVEVSAETYAIWRQARVALDDERGARLSDDELIQTLCKRACEPVPAGTGDVTRPGFQISVTTCKQCKRGFHVGPGVEVEVPSARLVTTGLP